MTNDLRTAFAHPEARAAATGGPVPLDRISLRDYVEEVEIGAFQAERGTTQRIQFNVVVEVRPSTKPLDDDVDRVMSYDTITEAIQHELAAERLNLLETLAERTADRILMDARAERVFVRIEKLDREPGALGVEIVRSQRQTQRAGLRSVPATQAEADARLHPMVVYLGNDAIASDRLGDWLDALEAHPLPVIICVGPGDQPTPRSTSAPTQRRIDLLAIEQNAWVLAARDDRCVVVESRTELEWAMSHGRISVWAPSKLVLDARDGPAARDPEALAQWFAHGFDARRMVFLGAANVPRDKDIPTVAPALDDPGAL
ncbi:diguanylate cyclase [Maritimibacter sp. 55A14]|uniref:dihydroneopterin aldolase n=1 Tax=Maritimibacter sp. 55A14 TaxID=2174844 RepID=UPI000D609413|nr:dihydroneopterin aldolase [Maritimibacter sp. 55A14]PWE33671.1 diguanylate cyclase [Maritimibacter sp. 55A14]